MITTFIKRVFGVWLLVLLPALAYAGPPSSGSYAAYFSGQQGVWDLSGHFPFSELYGASGDLTIVQDDKGKIRGQGTVTGSQDGLTVDVDLTASGSIKSLGDVTRAAVKVKIGGTITDGYDELTLKGTLKLTADVDKPTGSLIGTATGKICVKGEGCLPIDEAMELPLPADGSWVLILNIQNVDGIKLTGTATAELYNLEGQLRTETFTLKGKYNANTGLAKLSLKGSAGNFTIQAYDLAGDLIFQSITGKLLGQAVNQ